MRRGADARRDVGHGEPHGINEAALEPAMDAAIARVALGIGPKPAIGVDGVVQRLRAVTDIVA